MDTKNLTDQEFYDLMIGFKDERTLEQRVKDAEKDKLLDLLMEDEDSQ